MDWTGKNGTHGLARLVDLELSEVSVVDAPANPGARILLAKMSRPDPLAAVVQKAARHVSTGEVAQAVQLAKTRVAGPRSFWAGHLDALAKSLSGPGIPPSMGMTLALQHPDGRELLAAMARATQE